RGVVTALPSRTGVPPSVYSGLIASISAISCFRTCASSSRNRIDLPSGYPSNAFVVVPGNMMTMPSPMPCIDFRDWRSSPTPKASNTTTDTVPQVMPRTVRIVRSFCARTSFQNCSSVASRRIWRSARLLDDLDRLFLDNRSFLDAGDHLNVYRVAEASCYNPIFHLPDRGDDLHARGVTRKLDDTFGDHEY